MNSKTNVAAVTVVGQKHLQRGIPCEDSSVAVSRNGVSVVCIADGAGGKVYTHAKYGGECVTQAVSELLIDHFDALYFENREAAIKAMIITAAHTALADVILKYKLNSIEKLSCTLLFCAVKDRRMICGHIGDGLIARISPSGISPVTMPQNGKIASTTYFVTSNHAADYLRLTKGTIDDVHAIVLMTDGVQDSVYDETSGLVKPVVVRMADTLKEGREHFEKEVKSVLEDYIVNKSNVSDDSSFGALYFVDTKSPDVSSLPSRAEAFPRATENFRQLQELLLPRVKKARQIILNSSASISIDSKTSKGEPKRTTQSVVQAMETEDKISPMVRVNRRLLHLVFGSFIFVIIVLILYAFFFK